MSERTRRMAIVLLIVAALVCVYAQTAWFGTVNFDDRGYVGNPNVMAGLSVASVKWALTTFDMSNYAPLVWLSYQLDATIFGGWHGGFHLTNVAFHVANSLLLLLVLHRATGAFGASAWVAILFALHPLRAESVAWISERKDVACVFFALLSMLAYLRYTLQPSLLRYLPVAIFFALSLLTKAMLVTLPALLLVLDYWPLRRVNGLSLDADAPDARPLRPARSMKMLLLEKIPLLALSVAISLVTVFSQAKSGAVLDTGSLSLPARLGVSVAAYARYIGLYFWPVDLAPFYHHLPSGPRIAFAALLLVGLSAAAIMLRKKHPYLIVGWLWFLGTLVPVIGIVQVGGQTTADRYTYFPHLGISIAIVWLLARVARPEHAKFFPWAAAALAVVLGAMSYRQVGYWRDSYTLWTHAVKVQPEDVTSITKLGDALNRLGKKDEALARFLEASRVAPAYFEGRMAAAQALFDVGQVREAIEHLGACVGIRPRAPQLRAMLGQWLLLAREPRLAAVQLRAAIELDPADARSMHNLGLACLQLGDAKQALGYFEQAARAASGMAAPHVQAGALLESADQLDAAAAHYRAAIAAEPRNSQAHNGLGVVLARQGQLGQAADYFAKALELDPTNADARANLDRAKSK